jgi:hypothetical protein
MAMKHFWSRFVPVVGTIVLILAAQILLGGPATSGGLLIVP